MIRKAEKEDSLKVAKLIISGWQSAYRGLIEDKILNNMSLEFIAKKWEQSILTQNKNSHIYVYEEKGNILGVIRFGSPIDEKDLIHNAEIHVLYVEPTLKRHRIGSQLFDFAKQDFTNNNTKSLIIWCLKGNIPSIKFYEKMGGKIIIERKACINGATVEEVGIEYSLNDEINLVKPTKEYEKQLFDYKQEFFNNGEYRINASSRWDKMENFDDWLKVLEEHSSFETIKDNWTVHTNFLGVREKDKKVIGMIDVRHDLTNEFLRNYAGHIGYSVRPTERQKGYATQMLNKALMYCRNELKLSKVMISCDKNNEASRRTIVKAGGILEKEYITDKGECVQIYWISI